MRFTDRQDAGRQLARRLLHLRDKTGIVLGIPRGGVAVAHPVAQALGWPLDVVIARKVGAPFNPELALAAVAPNDILLVNQELLQRVGIRPDELEPAVAAQRAEMDRRLRLYRGNRPGPELRNRIALVVDDGLATGLTVAAAIRSVRCDRPASVILAVPVASRDALATLAPLVDELVCLIAPPHFRAVGQFYDNFSQVTDQEVLRLLGSAPPARLEN